MWFLLTSNTFHPSVLCHEILFKYIWSFTSNYHVFASNKTQSFLVINLFTSHTEKITHCANTKERNIVADWKTFARLTVSYLHTAWWNARDLIKQTHLIHRNITEGKENKKQLENHVNTKIVKCTNLNFSKMLLPVLQSARRL
jgi:hypothetical protein